ncbi:hypothetical protein [Schwartzia sp. (in: firmicutes)]
MSFDEIKNKNLFPQEKFEQRRYNAFVPVLPKAKLPLSAFQRGRDMLTAFYLPLPPPAEVWDIFCRVISPFGR